MNPLAEDLEKAMEIPLAALPDAEIERRAREVLAGDYPEALTCSREELVGMTRRVLHEAGIPLPGKKHIHVTRAGPARDPEPTEIREEKL